MYNPHKTSSATEKRMQTTYDTNSFSDIQTKGTARYQQFEKNVFNPVQKRMYNQLVYGFSMYTDEQVEKLHPRVKKHLMIRYTKAQIVINILKQKIVNVSVNQLFTKLFPKSSTAKIIANTSGYCPNYLCKFTFKELGLSKIAIAEHLIKNGLLPKNFFQLK